MQRRQALRAAALLVAGVGTAGCSEAPSPTPAPPQGPPANTTDDGVSVGITTRVPLKVTDFSTRSGPNDQVLLEATVSNGARVDRRATLRVDATLDGELVEKRQTIRMDSGETRVLTFVLDFDYQAWEDGDISLDFNFDYLG